MKIDVSKTELVWIIAALGRLIKIFDETWCDDDWVRANKHVESMPSLLRLVRDGRPKLGALLFRLQKAKDSNAD